MTGAARGIGRATALELARRGFCVAVNHRSETSASDAQAVAQACRQCGVDAAAFAADVSDDAAVRTLVRQVGERLGAITVCVNNAGVMHTNFVALTRPEDFRRVLAQNLESAFLVTRAVMRDMMRAHQGRIVNIASDAAMLGDLMRAAYSASKAGMLGLTRSTAREVAAQGITVNAVCPGMIETAMTADLAPTRRARMEEAIPMRRFGTPEDVARAVAFLCSSDAGYITGAVLHVNGGLV